ncbi:MAG: Dyp-type peroxidase [Reichenbachiella sp.]|uniref:Dyp-type peroxidase n=1 Tax=Reichenbachiella sp. TaxID=2184521 RepID=UPI003296A8FC
MEKEDDFLCKELIEFNSYNEVRLRSIQGNILDKHGGGIEVFVFLDFEKLADDAAKSKLAKMAKDITSAWSQFEQSKNLKDENLETFLGVYLTYDGYICLGIDNKAIPSGEAFRSGMDKRDLGDPSREEWELPFKGNVHACLLLIDNRLTDLENRVDSLKEAWGEAIANIQWGRKLLNHHKQTIEHFGYVDGISQPIFTKKAYDKVKNKTRWDPKANLSLVLSPEPNTCSYGSYLVFRKLEQNVKAFKEAEKKLAEFLGFVGETEEVAGALIVGRFENGLPVVKMGSVLDPEIPSEDNDFQFDIDPDGVRCPFHSHIRKTNPRGDNDRFFGKEENRIGEKERLHRIARRGITYDDIGRGGNLEFYPDAGVGLLFLCFQSNIENQFEFIQRNWVNNNDFPVPFTGIDPLIGQGKNRSDLAHNDAEQKWMDVHRLPKSKSLSDFVTMKGGAYFYAPSIIFFKNLTEET